MISLLNNSNGKHQRAAKRLGERQRPRPLELPGDDELREIDGELGDDLGAHLALQISARMELVDFFCGNAATSSSLPRPVVTGRWSGRPRRTLA